MKHPLGAAAALIRETGDGMQSRSDIQSQVWTAGLERKGLFEELPRAKEITAFARDPSTEGIVTGLSGGIDVVHQLRCVPICHACGADPRMMGNANTNNVQLSSWVKHKLPCGLSVYHGDHSRTMTHNLGSQVSLV